VMPCCGPMRMALAPEFQRFRFLYSTRRGSRPGGNAVPLRAIAHFEAVREVGAPIPEPQSSVDYVEVAAQAPEFWREREAASRVDRKGGPMATNSQGTDNRPQARFSVLNNQDRRVGRGVRGSSRPPGPRKPSGRRSRGQRSVEASSQKAVCENTKTVQPA
jgi:hypothetical protein